MKRFLITGITGFAGPNLANLLIEDGHQVVGLIRHSNGRETDILDIVNEENFSKIKFHFQKKKKIAFIFYFERIHPRGYPP